MGREVQKGLEPALFCLGGFLVRISPVSMTDSCVSFRSSRVISQCNALDKEGKQKPVGSGANYLVGFFVLADEPQKQRSYHASVSASLSFPVTETSITILLHWQNEWGRY